MRRLLLVAIFVAAASIAQADGVFGGASATTYITNLNATNLAAFTKKIQRVFVNGEPLYINMFGESTTLGVGAIFNRYGPPAFLAALFQANGITASFNHFGLYSSSSALSTLDPRWSFTGTWGAWTDLPGGKSIRATVNGSTVTYTPHASGGPNTSFQWDVMDVYYYQDTTAAGGGGSMTVTVDGGAGSFSTPSSGGTVTTQTISQTGTPGLVKITVTLQSPTVLGQHTLTVTRADASNNIEMYGFEPRNSTAGTILIKDLGTSGYSSTLLNVATINAALLNSALLSQLTIFSEGVNDWANGTVLSTYSSNIATLLGNISSNGSPSILLWTPPPSSTSTASVATQQTYVAAFKAAGSTTMVIADLWQRYTDRGGQAALASGVDGWYNDNLHPNAWGNYDLARLLYNAVQWPPIAFSP